MKATSPILKFHIFRISIFRSLYLLNLSNLFSEILFLVGALTFIRTFFLVFNNYIRSFTLDHLVNLDQKSQKRVDHDNVRISKQESQFPYVNIVLANRGYFYIRLVSSKDIRKWYGLTSCWMCHRICIRVVLKNINWGVSGKRFWNTEYEISCLCFHSWASLSL